MPLSKILIAIILFGVNISAHANETAVNPCDHAAEDSLKLFETSLSNIEFGQKEGKILKSIDFWETTLGRRMSQSEFNRSKLTNRVLKMAGFDRPYLLVKFATPKAYPVRFAYELYSEDSILLASLKSDLAATTDLTRIYQIQSAMIQVEARIITNVKVMASKIEEYEGMFSMLEKLARSEGTIATNAQIVLEKLRSDVLLMDYMKVANLSTVGTPTARQVRDVINNYPEIKLWNLRKIRNQEAWTAILAIAPTQAVVNSILRRAARLPWLNQGKFRAFVESLLTERNRHLYFPDIQSIVNGTGTPVEKLDVLENTNVGTNDELLITFKRRRDLRVLWDSLKAAATERTDPTFLNQMIAAEEVASHLDGLSLEGRAGAYTVVTRLTDLAIFAAANYYTFAHHLPFMGSDAKKIDMTRMPASLGKLQIIPAGLEKLNPTPLDEYEEFELDQMFDALSVSIK